ncbi:glycosyltransferase family 4 protein [Candidatus Woesearchaeota archaeon]|nr:glycosyltransferase family 4 protein [Candidatus Woesearchaeota archaeon]
MEKKVLVTATTFPRWKNDTTAGFVYDLSERLASKYKIVVLAPHHKNAKKEEMMGRLLVKRFVYFRPERLQKLCYGGGIIPNMKESFLAKIQMVTLMFSELFSSSKIIKKEGIGMVHAHWILPQGFVGVFLKKRFKVPLLVTVHGSDLFPLKNIFFKNLQHFVIKNADYVTVNSIATKNELIKRFPDYSPKISVIPMGIDTELFRQRKAARPKKYEKKKLLLFVGRLSEQKGLQYLIDSMRDIVKYEPKVKLLIIGTGPYKKVLKEKAKTLGVESYIQYLGSLPKSDVARHYNFCDIFILPSISSKIGTEALGLSLIEAMSSGCAVIGTNSGGIPYIIKDGYNGLLVREKDHNDLSNAIITLLKDRKKSKNLGRNAAKFARQNYSWKIIAKDFAKIYGKALQ